MCLLTGAHLCVTLSTTHGRKAVRSSSQVEPKLSLSMQRIHTGTMQESWDPSAAVRWQIRHGSVIHPQSPVNGPRLILMTPAGQRLWSIRGARRYITLLMMPSGYGLRTSGYGLRTTQRKVVRCTAEWDCWGHNGAVYQVRVFNQPRHVHTPTHIWHQAQHQQFIQVML